MCVHVSGNWTHTRDVQEEEELGGWVDGVTSGLTCAVTPSDAV